MNDAAKKLYNSAVYGFKSQFTRHYKVLQKYSLAFTNIPSKSIANEMESCMKSMESYKDKMIQCFEQALEADPSLDPAHFDTNIEDITNEYVMHNIKIQEIFEQMQVYPSSQDVVQNPPKSQGTNPTSNPFTRGLDKLQPKTLTKDASMVEFSSWQDKFHAYFAANDYDRFPAEQQRAFFNNCIDGFLQAKVKESMLGQDLTVYPITASDGSIVQEGTMNILIDEFNLLHPVLNRRLDFFRSSQKAGQTWSTWAMKLKNLGCQADLGDLTIENIIVMRYLCGTNDEKLREKFLKEQHPTKEDLEHIARVYETSQKQISSLSKDKLSSLRSSNSSKHIPDKSFIVKHKSDLRNRCASCGMRNADRASCQFRNAQCSSCKKQGHISRVCLKQAGRKLINQGARRGRRQFVRSNSRGRGRSKTRYAKDKERRNYTKRSQSRSSNSNSRSRSSSVNSLPRSHRLNSMRSGAPITKEDSSHSKLLPLLRMSHDTHHPDTEAHTSDDDCNDTPKIKMKMESISKDASFDPFNAMVTPDSGATRSVLSYDIIKKKNIPFAPTQEHIRSANNTPLDCKGEITMRVTFKDITDYVTFIIIKGVGRKDIFLSWQDMIKFRLLHENFPNPISDSNRLEEGISHTSASLCHLESSDKTTISNTHTSEINSLLNEFDDLFQEKIGIMKGEPVHIDINDNPDFKFRQCAVARPIPHHFLEDATDVIKKYLKDGIFEKTDGPSKFLHPALFVQKPGKNMGVRFVLDLSAANLLIKKAEYPLASTQDVLQAIPHTAKCFAKIDMTSSFYQIALDEPSKDLFHFLLAGFGRFRLTRLPQGLKNSPFILARRIQEAIQGLDGVISLMDDILVYGENYNVLLLRLRKLFEVCRRWNFTLSRKKFVASNSVKFGGYIVSDSGFTADPEKVSSIAHFPKPRNVSDIRSFLGLAQTLASFVPDLSHTTEPMRQLLKKGVSFTWNNVVDKSFTDTKKILTGPLLVVPYDPTKRTEIVTDASRSYGIGYAVIQRGDNDEPRLIKCGSRSLNKHESNYSVTELELLATVWGVKHASFYLLGGHFKILTDHKASISLLNHKTLDQIDNPRILRLKEKLSCYDFEAIFINGRKHFVADALSRNPHFSAPEINEADISSGVIAAFTTDPLMQDIFDAAEKDTDYQAVISAIKQGKHVSLLSSCHPAKKYSSVWNDLSIYNDKVIMLNEVRIVVPSACQRTILDKLHLSHAGITKTRANARLLYYWPNMSRQIAEMIANCEECQQVRSSLPQEDFQFYEPASYPFEKLGTDLFEYKGSHYIVVVDRFSGMIFAKKIRYQRTSSVLKYFRQLFNMFQYSREVVCDSGPCYRDTFEANMEHWGVKVIHSSAHFPQSNGLSESAVKSAKRILEKVKNNDEAFQDALAEWNRTPREGQKFSPSDIFYGLKTRGQLPITKEAQMLYKPEIIKSRSPSTRSSRYNLRPRETLNKPDRLSSLKENNNNFLSGLLAYQTRSPQQFKEGDKVRIQCPLTLRWKYFGTIASERASGRSFLVKFKDGTVKLRNRRFLKLLPPPPSFSPLRANKSSLRKPDSTNKTTKGERRKEKHVSFYLPCHKRGRQKPIVHHLRSLRRCKFSSTSNLPDKVSSTGLLRFDYNKPKLLRHTPSLPVLPCCGVQDKIGNKQTYKVLRTPAGMTSSPEHQESYTQTDSPPVLLSPPKESPKESPPRSPQENTLTSTTSSASSEAERRATLFSPQPNMPFRKPSTPPPPSLSPPRAISPLTINISATPPVLVKSATPIKCRRPRPTTLPVKSLQIPKSPPLPKVTKNQLLLTENHPRTPSPPSSSTKPTNPPQIHITEKGRLLVIKEPKRRSEGWSTSTRVDITAKIASREEKKSPIGNEPEASSSTARTTTSMLSCLPSSTSISRLCKNCGQSAKCQCRPATPFPMTSPQPDATQVPKTVTSSPVQSCSKTSSPPPQLPASLCPNLTDRMLNSGQLSSAVTAFPSTSSMEKAVQSEERLRHGHALERDYLRYLLTKNELDQSFFNQSNRTAPQLEPQLRSYHDYFKALKTLDRFQTISSESSIMGTASLRPSSHATSTAARVGYLHPLNDSSISLSRSAEATTGTGLTGATSSGSSSGSSSSSSLRLSPLSLQHGRQHILSQKGSGHNLRPKERERPKILGAQPLQDAYRINNHGSLGHHHSSGNRSQLLVPLSPPPEVQGETTRRKRGRTPTDTARRAWLNGPAHSSATSTASSPADFSFRSPYIWPGRWSDFPHSTIIPDGDSTTAVFSNGHPAAFANSANVKLPIYKSTDEVSGVTHHFAYLPLDLLGDVIQKSFQAALSVALSQHYERMYPSKKPRNTSE